MRNFVAAIAAIFAALATFTYRLVRRAGKMILEMVREPAMPQMPAPTVPEEQPSRSEDYAGVRRVAGLLAAGMDPSPQDLKGIPPLVGRWLKVLDRQSLVRVAAASDESLRAHLRDRLRIRGLVPADGDSIAAQEQAQRPVPRERSKPTLRDLLKAKAIMA